MPPMTNASDIIAADIIAALGGRGKTAEIVGVKPPAVSMARSRGIPAAWRLPLYQALIDAGHPDMAASLATMRRVQS